MLCLWTFLSAFSRNVQSHCAAVWGKAMSASLLSALFGERDSGRLSDSYMMEEFLSG
jgi:hypothetical protein